MKKSLLLGTALLVGVAGFSQSTAKKVVNPKYYLQKKALYGTKIAAEPKSTGNGTPAKKKQNSSLSGCTNSKSLTSSYNFNGVGGSVTSSEQNCLSYNSDLNTLVWTQRGSDNWPLNTTSGFLQATLINATTLALDSVILYNDATTHHARYPAGTLLNPAGNTDIHKAFAIGIGVTTDNTNWVGTAYVAKPLGSASAVNHTAPAGDSLYTPSSPTGVFGTNCEALTDGGAPSSDVQALPNGKSFVSVGNLADSKFTAQDASPAHAGIFVKGTLDNTGKIVNWVVDTTSLTPDVHKGTLGYILQGPRMAFGPDGQHGYVVFLGLLNTVFNNKSDSTITPIVYQTTNGGGTWTQVLAGYDWMANHPEVRQNVGGTDGNYRDFTFDQYAHGADLVVDANNVLHYVTTVSSSVFQTGDMDSLGIYGPTYSYDYINYHPIIWDFMTDGTCWKTMMVDSIISAPCGDATGDTTSAHSAVNGGTALAVTSHITVSRSLDGTKIFYGWADSDPGVTGSVYNTNPDILMKAYDLSSGMVSATTNVTNGTGTCFYPFLSDISYFDGTEWVIPAVYTVGHFIATSTGQTTYISTEQADYYLTNCGRFTAAEIATPVSINNPKTGVCALGIKINNAFESSISNYPNPFNNTTTIAVNLSENKAVDVKIYNALGNLVFSKKVNGTVGENTVNFDGGQLSSGVYYYTVTAGNEQATKKMIIQK